MTTRRAIGDHLMFLGKFLRSPRNVGSVIPSSQALAREMARAVPVDPAAIVVELGPGTGALTRQVMEVLAPGERFLAIDIDPEFCDNLRARWPAIDCECGSAADLPKMLAARRWNGVNHVLSGLPFASLPAAISRAILAAVGQSLVPGGTFSTFQYVHAYAMPPAVKFRAQMAEGFGPVMSRQLVVRNFPPAYVMTWKK
jgi:phosphatidylethanolamine/phosphatidyl-N-methylethanolamine N-methyltransferase